MTRLILLLFIVLLPNLSHAETQVFSKSPSSSQRPVWIDDIVGRDDDQFTLRNDRVYSVDQGTVIERIPFGDMLDFINFFDFENKIVFHRSGRVGESVYVTPFRDFEVNRINRIKEYGCYLVKNKNQRDLADFRDKFCGDD